LPVSVAPLSLIAAAVISALVIGSAAAGASHGMAAGDAANTAAVAPGAARTLVSDDSEFGSSWPQADPQREWLSAILGGILSGVSRVY
jgi:hypothetical protein